LLLLLAGALAVPLPQSGYSLLSPSAASGTFLIHFKPHQINSLKVHSWRSVLFNCTQITRRQPLLPPLPVVSPRFANSVGHGTSSVAVSTHTTTHTTVNNNNIHAAFNSTTYTDKDKADQDSGVNGDHVNVSFTTTSSSTLNTSSSSVGIFFTTGSSSEASGGVVSTSQDSTRAGISVTPPWDQGAASTTTTPPRDDDSGIVGPLEYRQPPLEARRYVVMIWSSNDLIAKPVLWGSEEFDDGCTSEQHAKLWNSGGLLSPTPQTTPKPGNNNSNNASSEGNHSTPAPGSSVTGSSTSSGSTSSSSRAGVHGPLRQWWTWRGRCYVLMEVLEGQQHNFSVHALHVGRVTMSVSLVDKASALLAANGELDPSLAQDNGAVLATAHIPIETVRGQRTADLVFDSSAAAIAILITFGIGCCTDTDSVKRQLKFPVSLIIGFCCQFILMPVVSNSSKLCQLFYVFTTSFPPIPLVTC
jgi:hypothetical protein